MIQVREVSKTFNSGRPNEVKALQKVSLNVGPGEYVLIAGGNGSGKSTLLNVIAGNQMPDSGSVWLDNSNITLLTEYERARWISRVFQNPQAGTASELTVAENFRLAALRASSKKLTIGLTKQFEEEVNRQITQLAIGLDDKTRVLMGDLSGGQRQALTLLMAVMTSSRLLLMDEPSAALDPKTGTLVMNLANSIIRRHNLSAVLVTHNLKEMIQYGDRLLFMQEGKVVREISGIEKQQLKKEEILGWFGGE